MKEQYSAAELVAMKIPSLPSSVAGMMQRAKKQNWRFTEVACQGGKNGKRREYTPPAEIMKQIQQREIEALLKDTASPPMPALQTGTEVAVNERQSLTDRQRQVESARMGILTAIDNIMAESGAGKDAAICTLLTQAKMQGFEHIAKMFDMARDERGASGDLPSTRTIKRWFRQREEHRLAPKIKQASNEIPAWAHMFLKHYQQPQKPSVQMAYMHFAAEWQANQPLSKLPSIHQARRFLTKMGNVCKQKGRMGERDIKNIKPYKIREFDHLMPTDIYTADGHTFDAEIMHPDSGKPFRPEITTIMDVATRKAVGWSIDLAESAIAVLTAISHASVQNGIGAVFYVDNGKGYVNDMMTDEAVGLMSRLGMTMKRSRAYSSQARGVIERSHQTIWVNAAKSLQSFMGKSMDAQAKQLVHKASRKALSLKNVPALANIKSLSPNMIPSWEDFKAFAAAQIDWYNNQPHRSLPKVLDESGKRRHMTPNECWALKVADGAEIIKIAEDEKSILFMPQVLRQVSRGFVQFRNNKYFSAALEEYHGDMVRVAYDIHDAQNVWIYDDTGRFICKADWESNRISYMPVSEVEWAKDKRIDAQMKRLKKKGDELEAARPQRVIEHEASVNIGGITLDMSRLKEQGAKVLARREDPEAVEAVFKVVQPEPIQPSWEAPDAHNPKAQYAEYKRLASCEAAELNEAQARWLAWYQSSGRVELMEQMARAYG